MTVNSAQELHDLINTLSQQFQSLHHPAATQLSQQTDQHIQHVMSEGHTWITQEIQMLNNEWQQHLTNLRALEDWFQHHVPNLGRIAQDALRLSTEQFA